MSTNLVDIKSKPTPEIVAFKEAALACGINPRMVDALMKRLTPASRKENYSDKEILEQMNAKLTKALDHMDEFSFANANLKELGIFFGIITDKKQSLEDKPTQIASIKEINNLNELLPELLAEVKRRGLTIDMEPVDQDENIE